MRLSSRFSHRSEVLTALRMTLGVVIMMCIYHHHFKKYFRCDPKMYIYRDGFEGVKTIYRGAESFEDDSIMMCIYHHHFKKYFRCDPEMYIYRFKVVRTIC